MKTMPRSESRALATASHNWQRHPENPIVRPDEDKWDHDACYKPYAIFDGANGCCGTTAAGEASSKLASSSTKETTWGSTDVSG